MMVQRGMKGSGHARWFERSLGSCNALPFYLSTFYLPTFTTCISYTSSFEPGTCSR